jgi:hypothetical protein
VVVADVEDGDSVVVLVDFVVVVPSSYHEYVDCYDLNFDSYANPEAVASVAGEFVDGSFSDGDDSFFQNLFDVVVDFPVENFVDSVMIYSAYVVLDN